MIILNKNQKKFFISAIKHFGERSNDVRLKELKEYADENNVILPTSALKRHCQEDHLVRGHYNLLLTKLKPEPEPEITPTILREFSNREDVIVDSSAFAEPIGLPTLKRSMVKPYIIEKGQQKVVFRNPVFVVSNGDGQVIGVHQSMKSAWKRRIRAFHDEGLMLYEDFETRMNYVGGAIIPSAVSSHLSCLIEIKELEQ